MNIPYLGEFAAIFTAVCWSLSALAFTSSSRMVGSQQVNRMRVLIGFLALLVLNWVVFGTPIPLKTGNTTWLWLLLSGLVGLAIGDTFLYKVYQISGPRIGMLLQGMNPIFGTLITWIFLGETLSLQQILGMLLTLGGIGWVVSGQRDARMGDSPNKITNSAILFGILAALGQAVSMVFSKLGMAGGIHPFAGNEIRMFSALVFLWGSALLRRQAGSTIKTSVANPKAMRWLLMGTFFGPVIGISTSLLAVQKAPLGVATTLMALPPVFLLPISYFVYKERPGWQAAAGTLAAIGGIALMFL
ncbi:MAG: DMT family transporter [bacterium]